MDSHSDSHSLFPVLSTSDAACSAHLDMELHEMLKNIDAMLIGNSITSSIDLVADAEETAKTAVSAEDVQIDLDEFEASSASFCASFLRLHLLLLIFFCCCCTSTTHTGNCVKAHFQDLDFQVDGQFGSHFSDLQAQVRQDLWVYYSLFLLQEEVGPPWAVLVVIGERSCTYTLLIELYSGVLSGVYTFGVEATRAASNLVRR